MKKHADILASAIIGVGASVGIYEILKCEYPESGNDISVPIETLEAILSNQRDKLMHDLQPEFSIIDDYK